MEIMVYNLNTSSKWFLLLKGSKTPGPIIQIGKFYLLSLVWESLAHIQNISYNSKKEIIKWAEMICNSKYLTKP